MKIAIIGRPNVGKSALFNRILKKRVAIVAEEEGVTRDRLYQETAFEGQKLVLIDAGGIDPFSKKDFNLEVLEQALKAVEEADRIIMVVDGQVGPVQLDFEVARLLLKSKKTITLAVNKVDNLENEELSASAFCQLGIKKIVAVSALQGQNIEKLLLTALDKKIDKDSEKKELEAEDADSETDALDSSSESEEIVKIENESKNADDKNLKIAIVGRANTGKSTLLNFIVQEKRTAVSNIPGTTRDNVNALVKRADKEYFFVDTAGIRRKQKEKTVVEKFAHLRTEMAIKESDICLLMLDVNDGLTAQDKKIIALIQRYGKGCLVLVNKWDTVKNFRMEHVLKALKEEDPFLNEYPVLLISAKDGRNIDQVFTKIEEIKKSMQKRVTTGELNKFVEKSVQKYHPPMIQGRRLRIYYLTQIKTNPPRFILFVNQPALMQDTYQKYLVKQLRSAFNFAGTPLFFEIKGKKIE